MHFGIIPVNIGIGSLEQMVGLARHAESVGFESVWTFEHVIIPLEYASKYPYNESGRMGADPETNLVDPLIALTAIAAQTETIRLGTGVNILSQVNPIYLAKQAASLDMLSGGRFMLGVGIGWLKEEFDALGVPFARRGARFDDYVVAMKKIWSGDVVEHQSDFLNWSGFKSFPLPAQKPHLPIIMGGNKGKIFERVAKHGQGWFAPSATAADLAPFMNELRAACEAQDRDPASVEVTAMWAGQDGEEAITQFAELGVTRLVIPLPALGANPIEGLDRIAKAHIG